MIGFNYKKTVQALNFFARASGGTINKMKALKLIWLSDRLHLRKYGRLITNDTYFAMKHGPVASGTRDILQANATSLEESYADKYLDFCDRHEFASCEEVHEFVFSKTDLECLHMVFANYSKFNQFKLSDLSHKFPEWKKFQSHFENELGSRFPIDKQDFFLNIKDHSGLFEDSSENIEMAKAVYDENRKFAGLFQ